MVDGAALAAGLPRGGLRTRLSPSGKRCDKKQNRNEKRITHDYSLHGAQRAKWFEATLHCTTDATRGRINGDSSLHFVADGLDLAEDAQQIAAENFLDVVGAVSAIEQGLRDLRQIGGGVHALRRGAADAIEVRAQAHVIHSGDFGDVIDVIDQRLERRTRNFRRPLALDAVDLRCKLTGCPSAAFYAIEYF